jgi:uncharacterized iron-regulated protein
MPIAPGSIWSTHEQRFVSYDEMLRRLKHADVVFLGEIHDNAEHHADQLKVLGDLIQAGRAPAVAMEQFDRREQEALDRARHERPQDARFVAESAGFDFKGWTWSMYEPIVARALAAGLPVVAANLSREEARAVVHGGIESLGAQRRAALAVDRSPPPDAMRELERDISEGHCGRLPGDVLRGMVQAQRVRDAEIADSALPYARQGVVVIAGRGHARRDFGAPFYLTVRGPALDVVSVGLFEVGPGGDAAADDPSGDMHPRDGTIVFDFLWFASAATRGDSCASFTGRQLLTPSQADARP